MVYHLKWPPLTMHLNNEQTIKVTCHFAKLSFWLREGFQPTLNQQSEVPRLESGVAFMYNCLSVCIYRHPTSTLGKH